MGLRSSIFTLFHGALRREGLLRHLADMRAFERLSLEQQTQIRERRLARLLDFLRTEVPYYRRSMSPPRFDTPSESPSETLRSLPLMSKEEIRRAGEDLLASTVAPERRIASDTGGSTGEVLRFHVDRRHAAIRQATTYHFYEWCGIAPTDRQAMLWGAPFDVPAPTLRTRLRDWMHPQLFLSSYALDRGHMADYAARLRRFRPLLLTSYPGPLREFCGWLRAEGLGLPSLRAIICSAEKLEPDDRSIIEAALSAPVFDRYGSREFANVAQECGSHQGLHIATDRLWLEIVGSDGVPRAPGEIGEIVITDLFNEAQPFVRYRTGDLAALNERPCDCGRTTPRLTQIVGRTMDTVRGSDGSAVGGTFWTIAVRKSISNAIRFQVHQLEADQIRIDIVTEDDQALEESEMRQLRQRIQEALPSCRSDIRRVDRLESTRTGKHRIVVSHLE